ncbi:hypothetical protein [Paraburkholderia ginsengisoli]|uniref:Uncharacterized protein n=1 Tax=Paraburkholderia ginsengisoli TaxID=311231 RepID=A0A7T4N847_9BURK|nr:hypothetical protein [Paraburkholderia ginsengisoli]QQC67006.1 hypothetical protein I6I06_18710 [Paraburkholderia ginsengisoli]
MNERLWCVHIEGLNDFIATDSHDSARQEALAINAYIDKAEKGPRAAILRAVVIEWPFTPASHARALHDDSRDLQTMPHRRPPSSDAHDSMLTSIARRVKEIVSVARGK